MAFALKLDLKNPISLLFNPHVSNLLTPAFIADSITEKIRAELAPKDLCSGIVAENQ